MPAAAERLEPGWPARVADATDPSAVLAEVRAALDDDLDTPAAIAAIDAAVAAGEDVTDAAALLGVAPLTPLAAIASARPDRHDGETARDRDRAVAARACATPRM